MSRLPSVLSDMNAFFYDDSYAGICNSVTLPKIALKTADMVLSGFAGDIERSLGKLEKLETDIMISDYDPRILGFLGARDSDEDVILLRGAMDTSDGIKTVIVRMGGFWKEADLGEWKPSSEIETKFKIALDFFELEIDGKEVIKVDKQLNIFSTNGVDHNKEIREALAQ